MIRNQIIALKDHILQYNNYFDNGYAEVYRDANGIIAEKDKLIFPTDTKGNLFYFRQPNSVRFVQTQEFAMQEGQPGLGVNQDIVLVAYVANADVDKVAKNLLYSISGLQKDVISFTSVIINPVLVLMEELSGVSEADRQKALQRLDERAALIPYHSAI